MKVYFAGSITSGREDAAYYEKMVSLIKSFGHEIPSEHIGNEKLFAKMETAVSDEQIYARCCEWIHSCKVMIAEVSKVSLGIGYEIRVAESHGMPVICFFRKQEGRCLSPMIRGNKRLRVIDYADMAELEVKLTKLLQSL